MQPSIHVVDSHTAGEPTRVVISGGPDLGRGTLAERREVFRTKFDHIRSATVNEPRGSDPVVGALLVEPADASATAGVIFFNNVGYLGMCGHGTIGVVATLAHLGRIEPGVHRVETPVGTVTTRLHESGDVSVSNVISYRHQKGIEFHVDGLGTIRGDVAWGGNWFFLVNHHREELRLDNVDRLIEVTWAIRAGLKRAGITGIDGEEIDHVELFGPPLSPDAHSRNFVLCPGKAYDRSPCGTGTSAKLACLFEDGKIDERSIWRQESIIGSVFEGTVEKTPEGLRPTITGRAYVNAEATLILDEKDPFCWGIRGS